MSERRAVLIKEWEFTNDDRPHVTSSGAVTLDANSHRLKMVEGDNGYPVGEVDGEARTEAVTINCLRRYLIFQANYTLPGDYNGAVGSIGFRLSNGTQDLAWDGTAWSPAGTTWNTEAEVCDHIGSFSSKTISVVIHFTTQDPTRTPQCFSVSLAYEGAIASFREDVIYRSLVPSFRNLRPMAEFHMAAAGDETQLDLVAALKSPSVSQNGFKVRGVEAVFDLTADQDRTDNLAQSFDGSVITFTSTLVASHNILIQFNFEPTVVVTTGEDWYELEKMPSYILEGIRGEDSYEPVPTKNNVTNRDTGDQWVIYTPYVEDLEFTLKTLAPTPPDALKMLEEVERNWSENPWLVSKATGDKYLIRITAGLGDVKRFDADAYSATCTMRVYRTRRYIFPPQLKKAITQVLLGTGSVQGTVNKEGTLTGSERLPTATPAADFKSPGVVVLK